MIFGRKTRSADESAGEDSADSTSVEEQVTDEMVDESDEPAATSVPDDAVVDPRADGPFDASEVDLSTDGVDRLSLGPLTITPFAGMGVHFQGDPETQTVYSALITHENSGLQLELFAAPTSGGLADELREDVIEEAQQAGGSAELQEGPFGAEVKRVLPMEGPEGEQLFHVSRLWIVDGPRWVLRGTVLGQASLVQREDAPSDVFAEFFRNVVVHRDDTPRIPGELLTLTPPELTHAEG